MYYVYLLRSVSSPEKTYIGTTKDVPLRLKEHNDGQVPYSAENRPWKLVAFTGLNDNDKAVAFKNFLKSGPGRIFSKKHWL
jgi:predicted GIY-YIG superfamily endonuclease